VNYNLVEYSLPEGSRDPFKGAVALYPFCRSQVDANTNLMILMGDADTWIPASLCEMNLPQAHNDSDEFIFKVYPGVTPF